MANERRQFERYSVNIPTIVEEDDHNAKAKDISIGGLAFNTTCSYEQDDQLKLIFTVKGHEAKITGIIRVKIDRDSSFTYGVAFENKSLDIMKKLVTNRYLIESLVVNKN